MEKRKETRKEERVKAGEGRRKRGKEQCKGKVKKRKQQNDTRNFEGEEERKKE